MPTLLKMDIDEPKMFIKITEKLISLKEHEGESVPTAGLYILGDGFVYFYEDVYAFSDSNNLVTEVIIADMDKLGLVVIDTKKASKKNKQLIKKLEEFLTLLYKAVSESTNEDMMGNVTIMSDRFRAELREEIIIQHNI